jgi:hypothetical protein
VIQLPHSVDARALADGDGDSAAHPHCVTRSLTSSLRHSVTHSHTHSLTYLSTRSHASLLVTHKVK